MFWVYVIINRVVGRRYIGQTDNLERRLAEHNGRSQNQRRFTGKYPGSWEILYVETFPTRREAMQREKNLKSGKGREWLDNKFGQSESA